MHGAWQCVGMDAFKGYGACLSDECWKCMGMPCTQCEVLDVGKYLDPTVGSLDKFLVPYLGCFSSPCIWDVAHLNCCPFSTIFNHFPSPILTSPHNGDPKKAGVM